MRTTRSFSQTAKRHRARGSTLLSHRLTSVAMLKQRILRVLVVAVMLHAMVSVALRLSLCRSSSTFHQPDLLECDDDGDLQDIPTEGSGLLSSLILSTDCCGSNRELRRGR
eukprot:749568-Hanusia_phi.AAC.1